MTIIVAARDSASGLIVMMADSAGTANWSQMCRKDSKIKRVGDMLIGFTSSYRMGQLLHYKLTLPGHPEDMDVDTYMRTLFIDEVRALFNSNGYTYFDNSREEGGTFLAAYRGRIFRIDSDYQVGESVHDFDAVGSGDELAIGSLYSTSSEHAAKQRGKPLALGLHERVRLAVQTAIEFNAGCAGAIHELEINYENEHEHG
jgi:hypothetical protein